MRSSFVIDASIAVAWVLPSQASMESDGLLDEIESGVRPVVPSLWPIEVSNALLALERRKKLSSADRAEGSAMLRALDLAVDDEGPRLAFSRIADLASRHSLSVYDAVYLELALRQRLALGTRDDSLRAAARRAGVRLL